MEAQTNTQAFKALSRMCLNNWHYIDKKVLSFHEGINFFTGHSGSGKSTVLDALQIVLYANTDGRAFFNKAAADDSDRNLIEYLRGMVNIGENNEGEYLRNKNFSTTIVLELEHTDTKEKECIGVVFDVETATNEVSRLFFWHRGALLENEYRTMGRALTIAELKEHLQWNFQDDSYEYGSNNEKFRRKLYDIYLGGLDAEKFPRLFKRAIPFRMNIKLEDFVKEYICMEQDIQIEDMKESVMQYGRMRQKIDETMGEIRQLDDIEERYQTYQALEQEVQCLSYQEEKLKVYKMKDELQAITDQKMLAQEEIEKQQGKIDAVSKEKEELEAAHETLIAQIANSGYDALERDLANAQALLDQKVRTKERWEQTAQRLALWKDLDITPNQSIWDIEKFQEQTIEPEELERLQESLVMVKESVEEDRADAASQLRRIKKDSAKSLEDLQLLKQGKKDYPKELLEAQYEIRMKLKERVGKFVNVHILADLIEVKHDVWRNAVEGYLGSQKLSLVVEPRYAKEALSIYSDMDKERFCRVAVLDTARTAKKEFECKENSLAEEVTAGEDYVQNYLNFVMGNVIKCETREELRKHRIGITADCQLYRGFRLQHMNPEFYVQKAYIGDVSIQKRVRQLQSQIRKMDEIREPLEVTLQEAKNVLGMEGLGLAKEEYISMLHEMKQIKKEEKKKENIQTKMRAMEEREVGHLEEEKQELKQKITQKEKQMQEIYSVISQNKGRIEAGERTYKEKETELEEMQRAISQNLVGDTGANAGTNVKFEEALQELLKSRGNRTFDSLIRKGAEKKAQVSEKRDAAYDAMVETRQEYLRSYPQRSLSVSTHSNAGYEKLKTSLSCDHLEKFQEVAREQAKTAVEHFRDDFIFKIRSAIREAYLRRDELNQIINKLNFGKDKYQFVITKNKGADGKYYRMFMDDSLQIQPNQLDNDMENQMNLFTMEHEEQYGDMMNDLINIFIPPENATKEEMEEAKLNMDKYADYRTYLSFDMQQIVAGEENLKIDLSKMIRKNSGGEGQNPLYVALLASFAQAYKINQNQKNRRNQTIRLVVLDEAFSKMDAEKVGSCIKLIRGLGFQAIISATNDKIQNYLESVDKTFVFANPNKKNISIQEFERRDFRELAGE